MPIKEVRLGNIRSYELFSTPIDPILTLIIGQNGTGKTSLLEAIYYLCQGTSFRGRDRDMIAYSSSRAELRMVLQNGASRQASLQEIDTTVKKTFEVEGKKNKRLLQRYHLPVVLFEPDELRLISSSPERRRKFFDGILARLYPSYATILNRYQRTLMQRNELLKQRENMTERAWDDQLFIWDMKLTELALEITRQRREFVVISNSQISHLYSQVADQSHTIVASYHSLITADNYQQALLDKLHDTRISDSYRGYTSLGPHRDDFYLQLDGHAASDSASRGEMRTIMLAYKFLEVNLQQEAHGTPPVLLLDDVFSELDSTREQQLMKSLTGYQTIITATDIRQSLPKTALVIKL